MMHYCLVRQLTRCITADLKHIGLRKVLAVMLPSVARDVQRCYCVNLHSFHDTDILAAMRASMSESWNAALTPHGPSHTTRWEPVLTLTDELSSTEIRHRRAHSVHEQLYTVLLFCVTDAGFLIDRPTDQ